MHPHDEDDESGHYQPDAWKVAWEAAQDVLAPSCEVKAAAEHLVWSELMQQTMGWLLLTQIGLLLGSFGQVMSRGVCLLSWSIFMLEAMLKFGRSWAHNHFFMDVPCTYVPIHQEAGHDSLAFFGLYLMSAALLELLFYVPYIFMVYVFWRQAKFCFTPLPLDASDMLSAKYSEFCPDGTLRLIELLLFSVVATILHWFSSFLTVLAFNAAMGVGILALIREKKQDLKSKVCWPEDLSRSCSCNERGCKAGKSFKSPRTDSDRLLCLTWWVHMARHRHLSSVVASAQPGNCGLPGHWFETVTQLKRIVSGCAASGAGDHVLNSEGPLWVSQEMALRALVSLAKQSILQGRMEICSEILIDDGFKLLVQVVREGKLPNCRGLAAAGIGVLATQHEAISKERVDLTLAVVPLKRLVRSSEQGLKEVALGALLNITLNDEQCVQVLTKIQSSDGIIEGEDGCRDSFMTVLMEHAHLGPTTRCQELATGLLARLAGDSREAKRMVAVEYGTSRLNCLQLFIALLQHGLTTEIRATAAGVLAELAFREGKAIDSGPYGENCVTALVGALQSEPEIAYASARALCNLAIKGSGSKPRIINAGGIGAFIGLLKVDDHVVINEHMTRMEVAAHTRAQAQMWEQVQAEAAKALWTLAYNNTVNQGLIAEAKAIPLLASLLSNPKAKVYSQAVAALSALAWQNEMNKLLIGLEGSRIFPKLVRILGEIMDDNMEEKVVEKVALAIKSFAEGSKLNRDDLVSVGAKIQLEKFVEKKDRTHKKDKALIRVKQAIEVLERAQP